MGRTIINVKGIIKKDDKFLLVKRWYDDRIPTPYMWEFIDGRAGFGEDPNDAVQRLISENLGVAGSIVRPAYTWSVLVEETFILGIAYICALEDYDNLSLSEELGEFAWVSREEFEDYIDNMNVLKDLEGKEL